MILLKVDLIKYVIKRPASPFVASGGVVAQGHSGDPFLTTRYEWLLNHPILRFASNPVQFITICARDTTPLIASYSESRCAPIPPRYSTFVLLLSRENRTIEFVFIIICTVQIIPADVAFVYMRCIFGFQNQ